MLEEAKRRGRSAYQVLRTDFVAALRSGADDSAADLADTGPTFAAQSRRAPDSHLALVVGHFSFDDWYATFGDTAAMRVAADWLQQQGIPYDIACHPANGLVGADLGNIDPSTYTIVVFVCGPWTKHDNDVFLGAFSHCLKVGVNISVVDGSGDDFDVLLPRDLPSVSNADVVFSAPPPPTLPLVGVFLVHEQPEYGADQRHREVGAIIEEYVRREEITELRLDTVHVDNATSTRDERQLDNLLRRLDVVITTRLHGMVLSLRAGVPVVAIDPVSGGGKVTAQAKAIGWPLVFAGDDVDADRLSAAVSHCLTGAMTAEIAASVERAHSRIEAIRVEFNAAIGEYDAPRQEPVDVAGRNG